MSAIIPLVQIASSSPIKMAFLGDSITENAFSSTASGIRYQAIGFASWIRFLSRQKVAVPFSMNFGVSGETLAQIASRVGSVIAARPDIVCVLAGTVNLADANNTFASMKNTLINNILIPLIGAKIPVILLPIIPKDSASLAAGQMQVFQQYNTFIRELCYGQSYSLINNQLLFFADATPYICNYANANGDPLTNMLRDGIHPTALGAYWLANSILGVINQYITAKGTQIDHPGNYWNANNQTGNVLRSGTTNQGLCAGTTGTNTPSGGFTFTGTNIAAGFAVERASGTSTTVANCTKENPRTDGPNSGERQNIVLTTSVAGGVSETYRFRRTPFLGIGGANDVKNGDTIFGECSLEVLSGVNLLGIELFIFESGGAATQEAYDMQVYTVSNIAYPNFAHSGILRTPPMTTRSDSTTLQWILQIRLDTSSGAASCSVKIGDASLRKVV